MAPRPTLLLTRPERQSRRFATEFLRAFPSLAEVVISPLTELVFRDTVPDLAGVTGLVFTSETGVAAWCRVNPRRDLPVWAVGPHTARVLTDAGFPAPRIGPGDARGLATAIRSERPAGRLLVVRGNETAFPLAQDLASAGIDTVEAILYDQRPLALNEAALAVLRGDGPVVLPVFSPRGGRILSGELNRIAPGRPGLTAVAISRAAAEALSPAFSGRVIVATSPDAEGMTDATVAAFGPDHQG